MKLSYKLKNKIINNDKLNSSNCNNYKFVSNLISKINIIEVHLINIISQLFLIVSIIYEEH